MSNIAKDNLTQADNITSALKSPRSTSRFYLSDPTPVINEGKDFYNCVVFRLYQFCSGRISLKQLDSFLGSDLIRLSEVILK